MPSVALPVDLALLVAEVSAAGLPAPTPEFFFHPTRQWRFDLAWPGLLVAFEREGFGPGGLPGKHQFARGYRSDIHKYNAAQLLGYVVIRGTGHMLADGSAAADLIAALKARATDLEKADADRKQSQEAEAAPGVSAAG